MRKEWRIWDIIDAALGTAIWGAMLSASWLHVRFLCHYDRETLIQQLSAAMVGYPLLPFLFPPRVRPWILPLPVWCLVIGFAYCGDMGSTGHFITAGMLVIAATWAVALGCLFSLWRSLAEATSAVSSVIWSPFASKTGRWICRIALISLLGGACYFLQLEDSRLIEQRRIAASFSRYGMHVSFNGDEISIVSYSRSLGDRELAELRGELERLPGLEWLSLDKTQVTDAGLHHLYGLKYLRTIDLRETRVTPEGAAKLRQKLDCRVDFP